MCALSASSVLAFARGLPEIFRGRLAGPDPHCVPGQAFALGQHGCALLGSEKRPARLLGSSKRYPGLRPKSALQASAAEPGVGVRERKDGTIGGWGWGAASRLAFLESRFCCLSPLPRPLARGRSGQDMAPFQLHKPFHGHPHDH